MSYKRDVTARLPEDRQQLTAALTGIGMNFAASASSDPPIEDTVFAASVEGMERYDLRVLSVLTSWLHIHHPWLNADRLFRTIAAGSSERVRAFWAAVGQWLGKDRRFTRYQTLYRGAKTELLPVGNHFQICRRGEDPRFARTVLGVPAGSLRDRLSDVLSPQVLAARHGTYHWRVIMGPSYRADMWAQLQQNPDLGCAQLARLTHGSFATAWKVRQDWELLRAS